jgi:hypothetical protein
MAKATRKSASKPEAAETTIPEGVAAVAASPAPAEGRPSDQALPAASDAAVEALRGWVDLVQAAMDAFRAAYPGVDGPLSLRVVAPSKGFRRAGIQHVGTRDFAPGELTPDQIGQLLAEPALQVSFVPAEEGVAK